MAFLVPLVPIAFIAGSGSILLGIHEEKKKEWGHDVGKKIGGHDATNTKWIKAWIHEKLLKTVFIEYMFKLWGRNKERWVNSFWRVFNLQEMLHKNLEIPEGRWWIDEIGTRNYFLPWLWKSQRDFQHW